LIDVEKTYTSIKIIKEKAKIRSSFDSGHNPEPLDVSHQDKWNDVISFFKQNPAVLMKLIPDNNEELQLRREKS
jgi:hypothetical protein